VARAGAALPLELDWNAPAACPSADEVRSGVERSAVVRPGATPHPLAARAEVEQRAGRWVLRLHTVQDGAEGDRIIQANSCASLTRAAVLVLALALGQGIEAEPVAPSASPPTPPSPASPPAPAPSAPELKPEAAPPPAQPTETPPVTRAVRQFFAWSATANARARGDWGPFPGGAGIGVGAGVDATHGWWGASARVSAWPGMTTNTGVQLQTSFQGAGGSLSACARTSVVRFVGLSACAGFQAALIQYASTGYEARSGAAPWLAVLAAVRARVLIVNPVHVEAGFEVPWSPYPPSFALFGPGSATTGVYTVPAFVPEATLGLAFDI
jgi:hypothetical protein